MKHSPPALQIEVRPLAWLFPAQLLLCVLILICAWIVELPMLVLGAMHLIVWSSLIGIMLRRRACNQVTSLHLDPQGHWQVVVAEGELEAATLRSKHHDQYWTLLEFECSQGKLPPVIFWRGLFGNIDHETARQLQLRLQRLPNNMSIQQLMV